MSFGYWYSQKLSILNRPHSFSSAEAKPSRKCYISVESAEKRQHINTLQTMAKVASINCNSSQEATRPDQARRGIPPVRFMEPAELLLAVRNLSGSKAATLWTIAGSSSRGCLPLPHLPAAFELKWKWKEKQQTISRFKRRVQLIIVRAVKVNFKFEFSRAWKAKGC